MNFVYLLKWILIAFKLMTFIKYIFKLYDYDEQLNFISNTHVEYKRASAIYMKTTK